MKANLLSAGLISLAAIVTPLAASTVISVTNGGGVYSSNYLAFNDANGTHLVLDGNASTVTLTYSDQTVVSYPYTQVQSGLTLTGSWTGVDEWGYVYTASVQENLIQTRHSGSGRGGGYKTYITTSLAGGTITYTYNGAYAPPLIAPIVSVTARSTSATLTWTSASGGVAPYTYSVLDENGVDILDTSELTASLAALSPSSTYVYTVVTTDSAGRQIASAPTYVYTQAPTLNTQYTYSAATNTVFASWDAAPDAVSYSVFYYDYLLDTWVDGADTTDTSAAVSGVTPGSYVPFYIAAYDANGVETDYDLQYLWVNATPPPEGD